MSVLDARGFSSGSAYRGAEFQDDSPRPEPWMRCLSPRSGSGSDGGSDSDDSDNEGGSSSGSAAAQPTSLGMCLDCAAVSVVRRAAAARAAAPGAALHLLAATAITTQLAATTMALCPNDHPLTPYVVPRPHFGCDGCEVDLRVGQNVLACRRCDYDLCGDCAAMPESVAGPDSESHPSDGESSDGEDDIIDRNDSVGSNVENESRSVGDGIKTENKSAEKHENAEDVELIVESEVEPSPGAPFAEGTGNGAAAATAARAADLALTQALEEAVKVRYFIFLQASCEFY